jgi:hypothetical protein
MLGATVSSRRRKPLVGLSWEKRLEAQIATSLTAVGTKEQEKALFEKGAFFLFLF